MRRLRQFLRALFIGKGDYGTKKLTPAIRNQWTNFQTVWNDKKDKSFGVERFLRIVLVLQPYLFPNLYIRHIGGNQGILCRKIVIELYVLIKFAIPFLILFFGLYQHPFLLFILSYLMIETIFYLLGLVFLSDIYIEPISYKRSLILLFLNYIETTMGFAVLYRGLDVLNVTNSISAVYFSFVTSTTLGLGDILPKNSYGRVLVVTQLTVVLLYVILFFSRTINSLDKKYAFGQNMRSNKEKKTKE
jgi:hypothetical protein